MESQLIFHKFIGTITYLTSLTKNGSKYFIYSLNPMGFGINPIQNIRRIQIIVYDPVQDSQKLLILLKSENTATFIYELSNGNILVTTTGGEVFIISVNINKKSYTILQRFDFAINDIKESSISMGGYELKSGKIILFYNIVYKGLNDTYYFQEKIHFYHSGQKLGFGKMGENKIKMIKNNFDTVILNKNKSNLYEIQIRKKGLKHSTLYSPEDNIIALSDLDHNALYTSTEYYDSRTFKEIKNINKKSKINKIISDNKRYTFIQREIFINDILEKINNDNLTNDINLGLYYYSKGNYMDFEGKKDSIEILKKNNYKMSLPYEDYGETINQLVNYKPYQKYFFLKNNLFLEKKDNCYLLKNDKKEFLGQFTLPREINHFMNCIQLSDNLFLFYNKGIGSNSISFDYDIFVYKLDNYNKGKKKKI